MKPETQLAHAARNPEANGGAVNPPLIRASTILYPTLAAFKARGERKYAGFSYGIHGTPTTMALAETICDLSGGYRTLLTSSGLSAITLAVIAFLRQGEHILVADTVYGPNRAFCEGVLRRFGVEVTFYDPLLGGELAGLMRPNTRVVFVESPGSHTFEVQDIPAIAAAAHAGGAVVILDNTWATPLYFKAFEHGVDVDVQAGTKYIGGHSDLLIGSVTARSEELFRTIKDSTGAFGDCVSPDVCALALRGLRTMPLRLRQHQESALAIARWLQGRPEVARVLHPALPDDPGHALWKRDFLGASGLFGAVLRTADENAVAALIDHLELFGIGASWGGFESLVTPRFPAGDRTATTWGDPGVVLRFNIGLEAVDDLIADLEQGFGRLNKALRAAG